jgi:hypothetical protein
VKKMAEELILRTQKPLGIQKQNKIGIIYIPRKFLEKASWGKGDTISIDLIKTETEFHIKISKA